MVDCIRVYKIEVLKGIEICTMQLLADFIEYGQFD